MMSKHDSSFLLAVLVGGMAIAPIAANAQEQTATESPVAQLRRSSPEVFTIEVEVDRPAFITLGGQGDITVRMRYTVSDEVIAMVWEPIKLPAPKYYPLGVNGYQAIDYDADGNLILWIGSEGAMIRDSSTHEEYQERNCFRVNPDGAIVRQLKGGSQLDRYDPSYLNTFGMSCLRSIRWALGRPPPDDLGDEVAQETRPDGTWEIQAEGRHSRYSGRGLWRLVVDPTNGHLVRQASFGGMGEEPRRKYQNQGTRRFGGVALAERGESIYDGSAWSRRVSIRLTSFSAEFDPSVVTEAQQVLGRARTRLVSVHDYREDADYPKVRTVQAGDLDKDD